jgi:hypothetical protein
MKAGYTSYIKAVFHTKKENKPLFIQRDVLSVQHFFRKSLFFLPKKALAFLQELSPVNFSVLFVLDWHYSF